MPEQDFSYDASTKIVKEVLAPTLLIGSETEHSLVWHTYQSRKTERGIILLYTAACDLAVRLSRTVIIVAC